MMKTKLIVVLSGLLVTGLANAECPSSMSKAEMMKCRDIEKSGVNYQQWKKDHQAMSDETSKSPITGEDVRKISPAAGKGKSPSAADTKSDQ